MVENQVPKNFQEVLEWLIRKLLWFVLVPVFSVLSYITQIRPYLLLNHGLYVTGFVDGAFMTIALLIFAIWLISKLSSD
ncbi:MAG: hypothetical protein CW716_02580 [Candidatus Bathyarchaeum sp.]|nr:MAG: hypothetical protein CW716_02580 [Candidatus Bathyarchaeum sp.]